MKLDFCIPTPLEALPPFLNTFCSLGLEAAKEMKNRFSDFDQSIVTDINFHIARLWTWAMTQEKAMAFTMKTPEGMFFHAYKVVDGEEFHSIHPVPEQLIELIMPVLCQLHGAVNDPKLDFLLSGGSESGDFQ